MTPSISTAVSSIAAKVADYDRLEAQLAEVQAELAALRAGAEPEPLAVAHARTEALAVALLRAVRRIERGHGEDRANDQRDLDHARGLLAEAGKIVRVADEDSARPCAVMAWCVLPARHGGACQEAERTKHPAADFGPGRVRR